MTEQIVGYLGEYPVVRGKTPAELAAEEAQRQVLRRLCAIEDRLDMLEAQHRRQPPCDCPECTEAPAERATPALRSEDEPPYAGRTTKIAGREWPVNTSDQRPPW